MKLSDLEVENIIEATISYQDSLKLHILDVLDDSYTDYKVVHFDNKTFERRKANREWMIAFINYTEARDKACERQKKEEIK